jgi:hypothetical protein
MDATSAVDGAIKASKFAAAMDHVKNNRIEYLVMLVFSHMLGLTDIVFTKASGVCS